MLIDLLKLVDTINNVYILNTDLSASGIILPVIDIIIPQDIDDIVSRDSFYRCHKFIKCQFSNHYTVCGKQIDTDNYKISRNCTR